MQYILNFKKKAYASSDDFETAFKKTAFVYHYIGLWILTILNFAWILVDYLNIPDYLTEVIMARAFCTVPLVILIFLKKFVQKYVEEAAVFAILLVHIEDAYIYSFFTAETLQNGIYSQVCLLIGVGMFVIWRNSYSILLFVLTLLSHYLFFHYNSPLTSQEILLSGGILLICVGFFSMFLIATRASLVKQGIIDHLAILESKTQLMIQNKIIEQKNRDISDSINYAVRIQNAILPSQEKIGKDIGNYFILYKPRNIVSGDFYFYSRVDLKDSDNQKVAIVAVADCTGHGVPGAMMSLIGTSILTQAIKNPEVKSPASVLRFLNNQLNTTLESVRDGMDIALCEINFDSLELRYAGAINPVYVVRNKNLIELKTDKFCIGPDIDKNSDKNFTDKYFKLEKNDCLYLFTDGYADQFGGVDGKKLKYKLFNKIIADNSHLTMAEQKKMLEDEYIKWKGKLEQVDDILILGIRIP